jgi:hypothetical protein
MDLNDDINQYLISNFLWGGAQNNSKKNEWFYNITKITYKVLINNYNIVQIFKENPHEKKKKLKIKKYSTNLDDISREKVYLIHKIGNSV